ncbi:hypothetical protein K492DRAFT_14870 [Lichtheimia hyalospora FSU 10163]|nr:hypothetical protein K492DRAFT_14870 [Lichtheimia hyalospora FSU 10163]
MSHRYFCHACQAYQQVVMTTAPTCSVCHSQFIEQVASHEATTHNVDIDNELSERFNRTTLGEGCHSHANSQHTSDTHSDIVTDDQDEDYEDIDSDDDYEDDDYDEQDEISAFIESHRHESRYHHHYYDQDEWDYDIDQYYDEILDYNPSSDYYDGMDEFTSPWSRQVELSFSPTPIKEIMTVFIWMRYIIAITRILQI